MKSGETLERLFQVADHHTHPVCLAVLDIDYLKQINNTQGHPSAALALRRVGQLLQQSFGGDDVVGRWSGEEFVVGMYGMTRSDGVERIAEVLETVRQEQFSGPAGTPFHVTLSAGVAQYPDDGYGLQEQPQERAAGAQLLTSFQDRDRRIERGELRRALTGSRAPSIFEMLTPSCRV